MHIPVCNSNNVINNIQILYLFFWFLFFFFVNLIGSASGVAVDGENKVSFSNFMFKMCVASVLNVDIKMNKSFCPYLLN